jgi:cell division protein FtsI (penicillin-binding protein 3)
MHIASFVGIAPVNNPVIAVAVVLDSPKGAYYGTAVSAPVFAEVAQQVLEYLAVPHDIDPRPPRASDKADLPVAEDDAHGEGGDINALYEAANDLPSDDPQRAAGSQPAAAAIPAAASQSRAGATQAPAASATPAKVPAAPQPDATQPPIVPQPSTATVTVTDGKTLRVPSLIGLPVRKVIEEAVAAGLEVEIAGSGSVREQAPAGGTMVAPGTKIVVRCGR